MALLLGDDRQRALRFAADLLAQRAVAEGADAGDQHGEGDEREGEAPTGMAAARVGGIGGGDEARLNRIYINRIPTRKHNGILLTTPARTLLDCAAFPFPQALPIYDSALRKSLTTIEEVQSLMIQSVCDEVSVTKLLKYADPLSENGGESLMRGQITELSFGIPLLQVQFMNPDNPAMSYRVDFCWKLADGRIIVAEYDGMAKYADISNKNRASLQAKMEYDRRRDRHLREQGVTEIVHVFYEDLLRPINLETKLLKAGVPKIR